jgi:hypothetical protein
MRPSEVNRHSATVDRSLSESGRSALISHFPSCRLHLGSDFRNCQTSDASPAKPGDLL